MKLTDCIKKYLIDEAENETTVLPPVEDAPDSPTHGEAPQSQSQPTEPSVTPAELDFKSDTLGEPVIKSDVAINTKEDIQAVLDSVKMLWKFGVMNDSASIQKLIDPKHWEKFAKNNYFKW